MTKKNGYFQTTTSMSLKEIASVCDVDVKTVRRWIDKMSKGDGQNVQGIDDIKIKCHEAGERGEAVELTLKEAMEVIAAGRGESFAGALKINAASSQAVAAAKKPRLPSGSQINAMCWVYGKAEAAKRIDFAMGYQTAKAEPAPIYMIEARGIGPISKQAYAVEMRVRANAEAQYEQARLTPELGL